MLVLAYNLLLLFVDALALRTLRADRSLRGTVTAAAVALGGMLALALAGMALEESTRFYGSYFTFLGLLAWGLFAHGIPLLLVAARMLRARTPRLSRGCAVLALLLLASAVEGFWLGPRALVVTRHVIVGEELARPWRIVVLADLQTDRIGAWERRVLRTALEEEPDLILLPGDYVQADADEYGALLDELNALLREVGLAAPQGLFAVEGNVDREGWERLFVGLDAVTFVRTGHHDLEGLRITGLSFADSFDTRLGVPAAETFHVVLGHAPDFALGDVRADLLVAGHTHGGQVRLPGFGPPVTLSRVPRAWAAGRTELPGGRTLVVSRGLGMERGLAPRVRFFCRPELVVLELVPGGGAAQ